MPGYSGGGWEGVARGIGTGMETGQNIAGMALNAQHMRSQEALAGRQQGLREQEFQAKLPGMEAETQAAIVNAQKAKLQFQQMQREEQRKQQPWDPKTEQVFADIAGGDEALQKDILKRAENYPKTIEGREKFMVDLMQQPKQLAEWISYRDNLIVQQVQKNQKKLTDPNLAPNDKLKLQQENEGLLKQHSDFIKKQQEFAKRDMVSKQRLLPELEKLKKTAQWKSLRPETQIGLQIAAGSGDEATFDKMSAQMIQKDIQIAGQLEKPLRPAGGGGGKGGTAGGKKITANVSEDGYYLFNDGTKSDQKAGPKPKAAKASGWASDAAKGLTYNPATGKLE